jgi:hypothetical protein
MEKEGEEAGRERKEKGLTQSSYIPVYRSRARSQVRCIAVVSSYDDPEIREAGHEYELRVKREQRE